VIKQVQADTNDSVHMGNWRPARPGRPWSFPELPVRVVKHRKEYRPDEYPDVRDRPMTKNRQLFKPGDKLGREDEQVN
jgi:hypothetical protein